ncbi:MAG: TonB family protein [Woeseiaceae bacterium]|nr:TonB family protein [Woeseiaceae bacterium]
MSFEQFKTQVLLLHSEQSTLDTLSSGFNDRYTVHCATSGSEALNTLGETQIDVIVTAQELPGMSGLEALREAKKRSPDTIGILLAGSEDDGLEALVGDQEVFQVVRGSVTADALKGMIDNATQQARLIALAESANDTTANPDEPAAEHIVMETSENGSAIISDGTGRMPALDPKKISAASDVGASSVDVLVLTQDEEFLATVRESARGLHNVVYASTVSQADEALRKHKVGVAVVDAAMVGTNVEKLTMHLRSQAPRLVAIVAGRRDDGEMLMDLINRGKVYRFLLKPVSPGRSRLAIEASVKHHLEAPDSAFKVPGQPAAAPKPQPKPEAKPDPKPAAKPAPEQKPEAKKSKPKADKAPAKPQPAARQEAPEADIVANPDEALSPVEHGLGDAFGGDDSSFTETMTGIVETVTRSLKPKKKDKQSDAPASASASAMDIDSPPAADGSGGSLFTDPKILGIGAVALVAVASITIWALSGSDDPASQPAEPVADTPTPAVQERPAVAEDAPSESVLQTEVVVPEALGLDDLIDEARELAAAGQVYAPAGNNAIELYLSALEVVPGDPVAQQGLDELVEQTLATAESALLDRRANDALAALQGVELANPDNPRLPFLRAQLTQMQLRDYLDGARVAIRDARFEDAQAAIIAARALDVADTSEIDTVAEELSTALSDQRLDEVIAQANARLDEGKLIAPSNDNARYYFELVLSNDPDNAAARQGLDVVASKLVLQAREQIDQGNFDDAEALLIDARRLDPSSSDLAASTAALSDARQRRAQEIQAARDRAEEERAAAERAAAERAAAERAAAERAAAERAAAEQLAAEQAAPQTQVVEPQAAAAQTAEPRTATQQPASEPTRPAPVIDSPPQQTTAAQPAFEQASQPGGNVAVAGSGDVVENRSQPPEASIAQATPVSVSSLKRTKYVAPKYPRAAQRRALSGWVDVVFTVDIDGSVTDVSVRDSNPGDTFVNSAMNAVEKWEFEPVMEDGVAIQKRAAVRMMFAIE